MIEDTPHSATPPLNRMVIAFLALVGVLISVYLTLHKYGVIGSLACGTGNCETVQASKWAVFMGMPVPILGLVGYGALLIVALIGLNPVYHYNRVIALTLFVLADAGFMFSLYLTYLEAFVIHAWCRWCIVSAGLATMIWIASLFELPRLRRAS